MFRNLLALLSASLAFASSGETSGVITSACDLARAIIDEADLQARFRLEARCTRARRKLIYFEDTSGAMSADCGEARMTPDGFDPQPGDRLRLSGRVAVLDGRPLALCSAVERLETGTPPDALPLTGPEFISGRFDFRLVSLTGVVNDLVTDEVDPNFRFLHLLCDGERILVPFRGEIGDFPIGSAVSVRGICFPRPLMSRRQIGRMLYSTTREDIRLLAPPKGSPFDVPVLKPFYRLQPEEIARLPRHRVVGRVLALWNRTQALVAVQEGFNVKVTVSSLPLPPVGETVEAVGLPETDLYRVNLSHALWRTCRPEVSLTNETPVALRVRDIVRTANGRLVYDSFLDGRIVRLAGTVRQTPSGIGSDLRLYLESDGRLVPIDLTATPDAAQSLAVGSRIEVTGVCLLETETWQPNLAFPKVTGFTVAIRRPDDLRLLARPPFWTAQRLAAVIGILVFLLLAILLWNRALRTLADRRGLQLYREKVATLKANLRVDERTKLAVELHDSLAQNLTGVYMEIETAGEFSEGARPELLAHLQTAAATVKSCHNELRNCLWDLRNLSLEEKDMNAAIRRTLAPHTKGVDLAIRFYVSRARLTDNAAHAVLRIVRELTLNAVRHGHATAVRVAGGLDGDLLRFSVRDNGAGFDPDASPGVLQGHFGLEGIRERAGLFDGKLEIESTPGKGTKAVVTLHLAKGKDTEKEIA